MRPLIMTCGDPAGIGPEIAVKARAALGRNCPFVWLGDPRHLPAGTVWEQVASPSGALDCAAGVLPVLPHPFPAPAKPGRAGPENAGPENAGPENAGAVVEVIARAVALVQEGSGGGIVTCPINKAVLKLGAGFAFPGHTEFLAHLAGRERVVMMLACPGLRVVPVTIHVPLADVPQVLTAELLEHTLRITHDALQRDFGLAVPRLAVAGLNPHAGESGTIGLEEKRILIPVLDKLRIEGMALTGPLSADTMFHAGARAGYDAAICMYHDQALIPVKTIDFAGGVNVTLGLPFIRTSPDHGTAYDIAGQGIADPSSLIAALRMAWQMACNRGMQP